MPNMNVIRSDTPQPLRRLMKKCIQFEGKQRPLFPQIVAMLENLTRRLSKFHRSLSEPVLYRITYQPSDDLSGSNSATGRNSID